MLEVKVVHSNLATDTLLSLGELRCVAKDRPGITAYVDQPLRPGSHHPGGGCWDNGPRESQSGSRAHYPHSWVKYSKPVLLPALGAVVPPSHAICKLS